MIFLTPLNTIWDYVSLERVGYYLEKLKQRSPYNFTIYLVMFFVAVLMLVKKRIV
ncbi:MAG: hypothetical protein Q8L27_00490 [archaeon]|nr:hypothetical protein [archaeon]